MDVASDLLDLIKYDVQNNILDDIETDQYDDTGEKVVIPGLNTLFELLDLEHLDVNTSDQLLRELLVLCYPDENNLETPRIIMDRWIKSNPNEEKLPLFTEMIIKNMYDLDMLKFMVKVMDKMTHLDHLEAMIKYDANPNMVGIASILPKLYTDLSENTYKIFFTMAERENNPVMAIYIDERLQKLANYAKRPDYLIKNNPLPKNKELQLPVEKLSFEEQRETYDNYEDIMDEKALHVFRILGPVLPLAGLEMDPNNDYICNHYGGCRMFTCNCILTGDDDPLAIGLTSDWFQGGCMQCNKKIHKRIDAVRMPKLGGGWEGIYCSFDCLVQAAKELQQEPIVISMINNLENKMNEHKIYDRSFVEADDLIYIDPYDYGDDY